MTEQVKEGKKKEVPGAVRAAINHFKSVKHQPITEEAIILVSSTAKRCETGEFDLDLRGLLNMAKETNSSYVYGIAATFCLRYINSSKEERQKLKEKYKSIRDIIYYWNDVE